MDISIEVDNDNQSFHDSEFVKNALLNEIMRRSASSKFKFFISSITSIGDSALDVGSFGEFKGLQPDLKNRYDLLSVFVIFKNLSPHVRLLVGGSVGLS